MNCSNCQEQLVEYMEGLLDDAAATAVQEHIAGCEACRTEERAMRRLQERLVAAGNVPVVGQLAQPVMDQIFTEQVVMTRRLIMIRRFQVFAMGALAATVLVGLTWAALQNGATTASAAEPLARGVEAAANLQSIHMKFRMRTLPGDNFQNIDPKVEFADVELWERFHPQQWKIEKPRRVAAMDGRKTILLIDNHFGTKIDVAAPAAFDTGWLHRLAGVDKVLSSELVAITAYGYDVKAEHATGADGEAKDVVTVEVRTGDKVGEYLKNKFLETSDMRRVYTFDAKTHRLEDVKFYCRDQGSEVLILEIVRIDYDPAIDDATFELAIPKDVVWSHEPERLADNQKYEKMTPAEAARAFFQALAERKWDEAGIFFPLGLTDGFKQGFGGLEIIKIGEPFQAAPFPGWFVPYEIRLADGRVVKFNLAVRNDNPAHRYVVDGGI